MNTDIPYVVETQGLVKRFGGRLAVDMLPPFASLAPVLERIL
jgi:hypothetical protein